MTDSNILQLSLELTLQEGQDGLFIVSANVAGETRKIDADMLVSYLFYSDEPTMYGMLVEQRDNWLDVSIDMLLRLFSAGSHPYVQYSGATSDDQQVLTDIREAATLWKDPALFSYVEANESGLSFNLDKTHLSEQAGRYISLAMRGQLATLGVSMADFPALLPHFKQYGWPNTETSKLPFRVALRLTEPDVDETDWLLETILISDRGAQWSPAAGKIAGSIENALPAKRKPYAEDIEERQAEMVGIFRSVEWYEPRQFMHVPLHDAQVRIFIQEDLPLCQAFDYPVILPAWLKTVTETKLKIRTSAGMQSYRSSASLDQVLSFDWQFSLAGEQIDRNQFQKMVDENREYIRAGDEWFHLDPAWLKRIRELMEQVDDGEWTVKDLLFNEVPEEIAPVYDEEEDDDPLVAFSMQQSLRKVMNMLHDKKGLPPVPVPKTLHAELRPYQQEGFEWLHFMRDNKFGAVLADDMGLGKTVQLITYLLYVHNLPETDSPSLIICPTSVMGNWQKELERFAPSLTVHVHYGTNRAREEQFADMMSKRQAHIILTTYGTATQDGEMLSMYEFANVTIDEAQNIKNLQTKQSRAIRKLRGEHHIALTGTPIENRLSELWAIFDFIHKGYLGSFRKFSEEFIVPIERDDLEAEKRKLRARIQPFMMRRTKNDPELRLNLPEKLEQNEYVPLTPEQAALYESFVSETKFKLETLTGFERKGLILKMLSRLKQLCNHPALFLKEPPAPAAELTTRSNKMARIVSMAAEIAANGEQCLIFTQYIGMGQMIRQCLSELHGIDVPFLTGSMPKGQRDALVEAFQNGEFPIFILSLKAGGTGLNLTQANHVLHADRWWNPAVENQATDRAYRIGQTKFVHVHKFVTVGTIEEKIDEMLVEKAALSADLIHSSQWLTELNDRELEDLLTFN
ncbi:ATP-dependent helicase [Sporosarcina sp. P12(2017)]|uniref:DEAD/DEAH box helicase n=1 Tax=unclassified Sporosarcina TaxID=2647733 RepID=UPI000C16E497|nr:MULTISPECIES: DEAD/DEAH box helicase [unclassified Sporosarcina]PIC57820.1 ATP-dependent helicase [Sporosarcina sp. P10]PIC61203.1 ATP-dependent helicase [Sporosarcina sp. P12(2017)]